MTDERHLGLLRGQELAGSEGEGDGRRHRPRQLAGRPGGQADRAEPVLPDDAVQVLEVSRTRRRTTSRFMMEKEQYEPWQKAAIGYVTQPLKAYESNPLWKSDPKNTPVSRLR